MNVARVKIGRVKLRGGGEVRVITPPTGNAVSRRIREWTSCVLENDRPPDAFFAVALRYDDPSCASPSEQIAYESIDQRIPIRMLPLFAIEILRGEINVSVAEAAIMRDLGYERNDEPPDEGA